MSQLTLVTGGARSGKSRFAELLAAQPGLPVTYLATAQILDEEMAVRVEKHRLSRPAHWSLIEEPYEPALALSSLEAQEKSVILLDCITLWLSNLVLKFWPADPDSQDPPTKQFREDMEANILAKVRDLAKAAKKLEAPVILVSNEVGQGIVPEHSISRFYRDLAGKSNQILANEAEEVYLVVAGYPLEIKKSGNALLSRLNTEE